MNDAFGDCLVGGAPRLGVFLELGEDEMKRRVLSRGAQGSGRADDNAEALVNRFRAFRAASMPVIELLEAKGMLSRVSSEASPDEVYRDLAALLGDADLAQPRSTSTVAKTVHRPKLVSLLLLSRA